MRQAGRVVHRALEAIRQRIEPGVTTASLNETAERIIRQSGADALFRGVRVPQAKFPFPAAICASVNDEVVHGIPGDRILRVGDVVSVDCGVRLNGFCGDSATTIPVGTIDPQRARLLEVTERALAIAIETIRPGLWWSDVAGRMQSHVESAGFSVVREFVGHGIGREMHEDPKVPNYVDRRGGDFRLEPGMVLAVEPMVNVGSEKVMYGDASGWTVRTADGTASAHFEHTLAVVDGGVEVLTDGR